LASDIRITTGLPHVVTYGLCEPVYCPTAPPGNQESTPASSMLPGNEIRTRRHTPCYCCILPLRTANDALRRAARYDPTRAAPCHTTRPNHRLHRPADHAYLR